MARFQYRMQSILTIKYKLESQAKIAFQEAAAKLSEQEERLARLKLRREAYEEEARSLVQNSLDLPKIKQCRQAVELTKEAIRNQMVNVHIAQRNLEAARGRLNEVMKERKVHENLKEKEFQEFKQELEREESKTIDELVSYTYQGRAKK